MAGLQYDQQAGQGWVEGSKVRGWQPVTNLWMPGLSIFGATQKCSKDKLSGVFPASSSLFLAGLEGCDNWLSAEEQTANHAIGIDSAQHAQCHRYVG